MGASGHNSGIVCTGVDAPLGSLERCLIRDSISQLRPFCRQMNIPMRDKCGSLVCIWPWDLNHDQDTNKTDELLVEVAKESWDAGDEKVSVLDSTSVRQMEPSINSQVQGAVHIPGEIVVDPWLYTIALAVRARDNGATIYTNFEYDYENSYFDAITGIWTVVRKAKNGDNVSTDTPRMLHAKVIVNATGVYADIIQSKTSGLQPPPFEVRPRRGQYTLFSYPSSISCKLQRPIQPIPTKYSKGIFIFSSLYDQIVIGPTATDQTSRTDTTIDPVVADQLILHGKRVLPELFSEGLQLEDGHAGLQHYIGEYVGIRPATTHRDYQIHVYYEQRWVTAAGIRSTGLTASLGIGNHVARCILHSTMLTSTIDNFESQPLNGIQDSQQLPKTTPLPPLSELVDQFHQSGEKESVTIGGYAYRVTHPITIFGWRARTGLAA